MKRLYQKALAVWLTVCITISGAAPVLAAGEPWYARAMEHAVANGLYIGDQDGLSPEKELTRAQLATIAVRAFAAPEEADVSAYRDLVQDDWYYSAMAKAVRMGIFQGDGAYLYPNAPVTREEVFTVLARCFGLRGTGEVSLEQFRDGYELSEWAKEGTQALVAAGYVTGTGSALQPKTSMTRAEFAQIMDRLVGTYCSNEGTYTGKHSGNVVVNAPGIKLEGAVIEGDLILADGLGLSDVDLSGVTVKGRVLVRGGNLNVERESVLSSVQVSEASTGTRIFTDDTVMLETVTAQSPVVIDGRVGTIESNAPLTVAQGAQVEEIVLSVPGARAEIRGTVERISVMPEAQGTQIAVAKGGYVGEAEISAPEVQLAGGGTLKKVSANADDIRVETGNTRVEVGQAASGVTVGGKPVVSGDTATTNTAGTDIRRDEPSSGSSGGTSNDRPEPSKTAVTGITLDREEATLLKGRTVQLLAKVLPESATDRSVRWMSSDDAVATVDDSGTVTGVMPGTAVISAVTRNGGFTAQCAVNVSDLVWFVDGTSGSDENEGTSAEAAFGTLERAIEAAQTGDTVVICADVALGTEGTLTQIPKGLLFTSKHGEEDHMSAAALRLEGDILLGGPTTFRDIKIDVARTLDLYANGYPLLFDTGVVTQDLDTKYIEHSLYVFGGGLNTDCGSTEVTVRSGRIQYLFGGGKATEQGASAQVKGDTHITITGGYIDDSIVGGGESYARDTNVDIAGSTSIQISGADFDMGWFDRQDGINTGNIFGGSWPTRQGASGKVNGGSNIHMVDCKVNAELYGGGHTDNEDSNADVKGVNISLEGVQLDRYVYGGGMSFNSGALNRIDGDVSIRMQNCNVAAVIGGGASASGRDLVVTGDVSIELKDCSVAEALVGGGCIFDGEGSSNVLGDIKLHLTNLETPSVMCSGMLANSTATDNAGSKSIDVRIEGTVSAQEWLTGVFREGCTLEVADDATLSVPAEGWYFNDGTTEMDSDEEGRVTLSGVTAVYEEGRWVCSCSAPEE